MAFDFTNDVFLLHFAFEAAESTFQSLVVAEFNFCQLSFTCLSVMAIYDFDLSNLPLKIDPTS